MRPIVPDTTNGLVLLNKEPGKTSFQALYPVKRIYGRTVGHTGTLDQFAEGLLVILVGKFTKFTPLFTAYDKVYEADFTFGVETDTLDPEGAVVFRGAPPDDSVPGLASHWVGALMQVPPQYSAIHVDGRRASDRVRSGQVLDLPSRPVTVYTLDVLAWAPPVLTVRIHCSKGTYVRAIARDWGRLSGFGAHVTRLRRVRVGPFEQPSAPWEFHDARSTLDRLGIARLSLEPSVIDSVRNGRELSRLIPALAAVSDYAALEDAEGRLVAVTERRDHEWRYLFVDRGEPSP